MDNGYQAAHLLLENNKPLMDRLAQALLERETLDAEELRLLIQGKDLPPIRTNNDGPGGDVQHVLKPESGRAPGFAGEQPSPA